jgi:hypothetical protein
MKLLAMRAKDLGDLTVLLPALTRAEVRQLEAALRHIERAGQARGRDLVGELKLVRRRLRDEA